MLRTDESVAAIFLFFSFHAPHTSAVVAFLCTKWPISRSPRKINFYSFALLCFFVFASHFHRFFYRQVRFIGGALHFFPPHSRDSVLSFVPRGEKRLLIGWRFRNQVNFDSNTINAASDLDFLSPSLFRPFRRCFVNQLKRK